MTLAHPFPLFAGSACASYVIEKVVKALRPDEAYYWATHSGAELNLVLVKDQQRIGVECKRMDAPKLTPSMRAAMQDLRLHKLIVICPGSQLYSLGEGITVMPLAQVAMSYT